jgi:hypothetical protein
MTRTLTKIFFFCITAAYAMALPVQSQPKYNCALTQKEYLQSKKVKRDMQKKDTERINKLRKIDPAYARKYAELKTNQAKADYIDYLINHEFNSVDIHKPENKTIVDFLKSLDFGIVSARDHDRCFPVMEELRKQYSDSLKFYYSALHESGCEVLIYNISNKNGIERIACSLKKIADEYKTGRLLVTFYEKEVLESSALEQTDSTAATIAVRGNEKIIEKLVIQQH